MITGDHAVTAAAIAKDLGIRGEAITGAEWGDYSDDEALRRIDDIGVIARVTPEHKVRLVDILKRKGRIVAMTGDGVNDAPALKKADIGVAMGITGTEVSKEAAVMILTDDNFATIVKAVEKGRALYDNLVKYIRYQMGVLFGMIWTFLGSGLFNVLAGVPFVPQQTLYVNFTTQVLQSIGLGLGEPAEGLMERPPRRSRTSRSCRCRSASGWPSTARSRRLHAGRHPGDQHQHRRRHAGSHDGPGHLLVRQPVLRAGLQRPDGVRLQPQPGVEHDPDAIERHLVAVNHPGQPARPAESPAEDGPAELDQWVLCAAAGSVILWVMEAVKFFQRRRRGPAAEEVPVVEAAAPAAA